MHLIQSEENPAPGFHFGTSVRFIRREPTIDAEGSGPAGIRAVIATHHSICALRRHAKCNPLPSMAKRMLAIANTLNGMDRMSPAAAVGLERQTLKASILRCYLEIIDARRDRAGARPRRLTAKQTYMLAKMIAKDPDPDTLGLPAIVLDKLCALVDSNSTALAPIAA